MRHYIFSILILSSLILINNVEASCTQSKWDKAENLINNSNIKSARAIKKWKKSKEVLNDNKVDNYYMASVDLLAAYDSYAEAFEGFFASSKLWYKLHRACDGSNSDSSWENSENTQKRSEKMDKDLIIMEEQLVKYTANSIKNSDFRAIRIFSNHHKFKIDANYKGKSYLQLSMAEGVGVGLTDLLLKKGAKVNEIYLEEVPGNGSTKGTALSRAVAFGYVDKLEVLLKLGADANISFTAPATGTLSPLDMAVANYMVLSQKNGSAKGLIVKAKIIHQLHNNGATSLVFDKAKIERDIQKVLKHHSEDLE